MPFKQQAIGCLWVPVIFFVLLVPAMIIGGVISAIFATGDEHAFRLGKLIGYICFPILCILSIRIAIWGTKSGKLPGTKLPATSSTDDNNSNKQS